MGTRDQVQLREKLNKYNASFELEKTGVQLFFAPDAAEDEESEEVALLLENTTAWVDYHPESRDAGLVVHVEYTVLAPGGVQRETSWYDAVSDCCWL